MTAVDDLVQELVEELNHLGLPDPRRVEGTVAVDAVLDSTDAAIAPARIPQAVRRFLELVDPIRLHSAVVPYPQFDARVCVAVLGDGPVDGLRLSSATPLPSTVLYEP